jgi:hypothetical protein
LDRHRHRVVGIEHDSRPKLLDIAKVYGLLGGKLGLCEYREKDRGKDRYD